MHNIEFSCRPESESKLLLLPRRRYAISKWPPGGQLQRFVRFSKLVMAGGFLHCPWLSASNSHKGVTSHGNSPDLRRHMSGSWNQRNIPAIMSDLPTAKLATSALHFLSPIRRGAVTCLQVHQAIAAPTRFQDPLPTKPHSLGIEFISLFRGYFGKSNIEFSCRPESEPKHLLLPRRHNHCEMTTQADNCNDLLGFNIPIS